MVLCLSPFSAPGFQLPPTPAGPTSPGLASLRQQSTSNPTRNSIASRLSGASSLASGSGTKSQVGSKSSLLRPGMSVPGDLTRDEDGDVSSSTRANDSQAEMRLNESTSTRDISQASMEEMQRLGRGKSPKATIEGAGIFAHLLAKNAETGRRVARQSEGGMSVNSGISAINEDDDDDDDETGNTFDREEGYRKYGTPSDGKIQAERNSDNTRSFLQNDSRLDALDEMTRESIFGGRGPRSGRESGASGRFSEDGSEGEGLEGDRRR